MDTQMRPILRKIIFAGLFAVPFIPLLVSSELFFPYITTKAFAFRVIVEIVFAAWLVLAITIPEYRPKRGAILYAVLAFLAVVGLADLFGAEPVKSFWSNFERMEGFVGLLHIGALFLVMSSLMAEREWKWWWNTSLAVSAMMVVYCVFQLLGAIEIRQGGVRVDGTLGNASYLAVYLMFHVFLALLFFLRSKTSGLRWTYGLLAASLSVILYHTATRGAILGLIGGLFIIALLSIFNREKPRARKFGIYTLIALAVFVGGFYAARNTSFVMESPVLARFATLDLTSWKTEGRAFVWPMALEGIKERPILGWGQENFNYVFAEHYQAEMFRLEPWFDRAHNIFLDWGISAGILGLLAYLSLYGFLLRSLWKNNGIPFIEKSVLTALVGGYFFHNLFVFDNLISYILFFSLLAYVHGHAPSPEAPLPAHGREGNSRSMALPASIVIAVFVLIVYFVNIKPLRANLNLIEALTAIQRKESESAIDHLETAYRSSRLGRPETAEWISTSAPQLLDDGRVSVERRNAYFDFAKGAVEEVARELAEDPRYHMTAGGFFLSTGFHDQALGYLDEALRLMPEKQAIHIYRAQALELKGDTARALEAYRTAHELAPENSQIRSIYEAALRRL